ncbi:putative SAM-dependent arginine-methyltransferase [Candidatus Fokinia solitaria]|uniref:Putative SAM-dependent arginine-methyltransferase n=1 Tax=Candidatus Fokinia solitaria TaxID=1802984 RepID=A0A2U8BT90_9RICK|nr:SAM-dependent methyltransferase [Candidatus Fokinia solitaria]AWD33528.1 putative SAM-dependent arginine-methyltransferase [Candidatus Fokinia solitaria]
MSFVLAHNDIIAFDSFMSLSNECYYRNAVIGSAGDFITAPEVSDIFNLILGKVALSHTINKKKKLVLLELGGGTGRMMRDILRLLQAYTNNDITTIVSAVLMLEHSENMAEIQKKNVSDVIPSCPIEWFFDLDAIVERAQFIAKETNSTVVIVSNEFFDALPVKQFHVGTEISELYAHRKENELKLTYQAPSECSIHIIDEYIRGSAKILQQIIAEDGHTIVELSPIRERYMDRLLDAVISSDGMFVAVDYGHLGYKHTNSIKFVKNHTLLDAITQLGEADISATVDFYSLTKIATRRDCIAAYCTQADFLKANGIYDVAKDSFHKFLNSDMHAKHFEKTWLDTVTLTSKLEMGETFKVLSVTNSTIQKTNFKRYSSE